MFAACLADFRNRRWRRLTLIKIIDDPGFRT
jgi:hypothetical protein